MKIIREMGYTHAEFFRLLPGALGDTPYEIDGSQVICKLNTGDLKITLGPEGERRLVLVVIPCTTIEFEYIGVSDEERDAFTEYFNLRFMKGLG